MKNVLVFVSLIVLAVSLPHHECQGRSSSHDLFEHLLVNHNRYVRPRVDHRDVVEVSLLFGITSVDYLEENSQTFHVSGYYEVRWRDDFLTWNPGQFANITEILLPLDRMWSPDLVIYNSQEDIEAIPSENQLVRVQNNGEIYWMTSNNKPTKCQLDVTKFPFDIQVCSIHVPQWYTNQHEMNISDSEINIDPYMFQPNGEWDLIKINTRIITHTYGTSVVCEVVFYMILKRKYLYYVIIYIVPVTLLSLLNLSVFFVPPESGERISLSISIVLSYAVFLTVISSTLPEVSDSLSIFAVYLLSMLFLKVMTCLTSVGVLNLCHGPTTTDDVQSSNVDVQKTAEDVLFPHYDTTSKPIVEKNKLPNQWKRLALKINKISFLLCSFLTVSLTILSFAMILS